MADEMRDQLVNWLNDALSTEEGLIQVMTRQLDDAKGYPELHRLLEGHIQQTRRHADRVRNRIQQLGASPSATKTAMGKLQGWLKGVSTGAAEDKVVKDAISDYAAENFEVASYTALIEAARLLGDEETARVCDENRLQDQYMADRIAVAIPRLIQSYMASKQAKRRRAA